MAATARPSTPTQFGRFLLKDVATLPATSVSVAVQPTSPGETNTSASSKPQTSQSLVATTAAVSQRSSSPGSRKSASAQQQTGPASTRTTAMAEEQRRLRDRTSGETSRQASPNPAVSAINALLEGTGGGSKAREAAAATTTMSEPLARVAKSILIPESGPNDSNSQTSPVSLSSLGTVDSTTAPTAPVTDMATADALTTDDMTAALELPKTQLTRSVAQSNAAGDGLPASRAFTFPAPAPIDQDARVPTRGMSLPMSGYDRSSPRSPSAKRHKCPYCSTDFTRHHNLKSHLLTHSQEKPYECPTCHARFRRLHDLKRHTKLHTGERPHTCPKCGRRFARGDALARHNKGQGGCAGRRSSFGVDEDVTENAADEDGMEGLVYHPGDNPDEDGMDVGGNPKGDRRRTSEPGHASLRPRQDQAQQPYQPHPNTYPPIGGPSLGGNVKAVYPPNSEHTNTGSVASPRTASTNLSSRGAGSSVSSVHFGSGQPSMFAQGGITESPKPLSPSQGEHQHRLGMSEAASLHDGRSSNLALQLHQHQYNRGAARVSSPMGLPPPVASSSNPPQLPFLPGLSPSETRGSLPSKGTGPQQSSRSGPSHSAGPSLLQQVSGPNPPSNPGSTSSQSHGQSSGASMRELFGGRESEILDYVRDLESRLTRLQDEHDQRMSRMQDEISALKNQLQTQNR